MLTKTKIKFDIKTKGVIAIILISFQIYGTEKLKSIYFIALRINYAHRIFHYTILRSKFEFFNIIIVYTHQCTAC